MYTDLGDVGSGFWPRGILNCYDTPFKRDVGIF